MNIALIDQIRQLTATGPKGFEGLIAKLLGKLTGHHFHLSLSGRQDGRDISSDYQRSSVIAVECKRYAKETKFRDNELLGELTLAVRRIPALDLWVLVASRDVPSQLQEFWALVKSSDIFDVPGSLEGALPKYRGERGDLNSGWLREELLGVEVGFGGRTSSVERGPGDGGKRAGAVREGGAKGIEL